MNVMIIFFIVFYFFRVVCVGAYCIRPVEIRDNGNTRDDVEIRTNENTENGNINNLRVCELGICNTPLQNPLRSPSQTVGAIIRGFKSAVSGQMGFSVWQRDMYEHIIRDANDYWRIINYIENNPATWETDRFYNQQK